ncbi:MAG: pentapeptide repeat-containing protein, partial [Pseudomonadota bacterium]
MNQETAVQGFSEGEDRASERWFATWRSKDFSWDGLADASWEFGPDSEAVSKQWRAPVDFPGDGDVIGDGQHAYRQANLQDYWRWSFGFESLLSDDAEEAPIRFTDDQLIAAGLLVEYEGRFWHILHRPTASFVDALSDETKGLGLLARALSKRLEVSGPDTGGVDNRVQLSGARVKNIDLIMQRAGRAPTGFRNPSLYIRAPLAEFETLAASGLRFGDTSLFEKCRFVKNCTFSTAVFGDSVRFDQSNFGDQTEFYKAQFGANTSFDR